MRTTCSSTAAFSSCLEVPVDCQNAVFCSSLSRLKSSIGHPTNMVLSWEHFVLHTWHRNERSCLLIKRTPRANGSIGRLQELHTTSSAGSARVVLPQNPAAGGRPLLAAAASPLSTTAASIAVELPLSAAAASIAVELPLSAAVASIAVEIAGVASLAVDIPLSAGADSIAVGTTRGVNFDK